MQDPVQLSRFERDIEELLPSHSLVSERHERFDAHHGLFYSPLKYVPRPLTYPPPPDLSIDALRALLVGFIRDEFSGSSVTPDYYVPPTEPATEGLVDTATSLRDAFESELVYGDTIDEITGELSGPDPVPRVHALLCSDHFGSKANAKHVSCEQFRSVAQNLRLGVRLVALGLPFRDQNRLRTRDSADSVTLAEAYFLIRLHCTALAIYQVLPTGADIVVLSDGNLYAPIFNVEPSAAKRYLTSVRSLRNSLNFSSTVSIVDLKLLVDRYDGGSGRFYGDVAAYEKAINDALHSGQLADVQSQLDALMYGMRWNYNNANGCTATVEQVKRWLLDGSCDPVDALPSPAEVMAIASRYASLNLALRHHNVVGRMLPTAVRGTMHPKPGQIGLPKLGSCFPWNGVAVVDRRKAGMPSVEVHSLSELSRRGVEVTCRPSAAGVALYYERKK